MTTTDSSDTEIIHDPNLVAALDIGTNSVRMSLVRLYPETGTWAVQSQHKETVRLGQGEFETGAISDEAIARGSLVLQRFAEIARGRGASEIVAIATAALREAENRDVFIERARSEANIEVRVAPGVEEARLIYLGVTSGLEIGTQKGLFIDIGGGSTELIVGSQKEHFLLESLKLGAIRVGNEFLQGITGPVPPALFQAMQQHVRIVATHALRKIDQIGFDLAIASSGTAMNLAAIAARRAGLDLANVRNYTLRTEDLIAISSLLCKLTVEERRRIPGLNPERADIIVSGAAVLQTLAEDLRIDGFLISDRSLREGVLVDTLLRRAANGAGGYESGVRRRSIERLGTLVESEKPHARHVAHLTLSLFDQAKTLRLHEGGPHERELLEYAALLHDIGIFVSHSAHHRHSYYLIRHSELAGFTDEETQIIANLAYFHRKSPPKKRHAHFQALSRDTQRTVRRLAVLLRLAEGLDRSHLSLIKEVRLHLERVPELTVVLTAESTGDPHLELVYVRAELEAFRDAFDLPLQIRVAAPGEGSSPPVEAETSVASETAS